MELHKICLKDLSDWVNSDWFEQLQVKPLSRFRVESYVANPHAQNDDVVLYYYEEANQVLAFRTVLPAALDAGGERFAWLSGVWTHPRHRRRGLARRLFHEVYADWNGRVAATNFSPLAKLLYEKSGLLSPARELTGKRFYLFVKSKKLLEQRMGNLPFLWPLIDAWAARTAKSRVKHFQPTQDNVMRWERKAFPDHECLELANRQQPEFLFRRGEAELKWMLAWPWLSTDDRSFEYNYPFSSYVKQYEVYTVKFFEGERFAGFLLYSIRNGHLKLLHRNFALDCARAAAAFLLNESVASRVEMLTVLDEPVAEALSRMQHPFVLVKRWTLPIYAGRLELSQNSQLQPSEGDFIFT